METIGYNQVKTKEGIIEKSAMRLMSMTMVWVAIIYLFAAFATDAILYFRLLHLLELKVIDKDVLTVLLSAKGGIDLGVLGILLGISFGGKAGQKYIEK